MTLPRIASRAEWLAERKELLAKEKAMTRARDALNAERRMLPMVRIDKAYVFQGPNGPGEPARPLRRPPPADPRALHVRPALGRRLPELLGRRRRGVGRPARAPPHPRHDLCRRLARAARKARGATRRRRAGPFPGTRRSAATSTTTSTSRIDESRHAGRVQLQDHRGAQAGRHGLLFRGRAADRAAGHEHVPAPTTATCSTPTRSSAGAPRCSAVPTTGST